MAILCVALAGCAEKTPGGDYPIPEIIAVTDAQLRVGETLIVDLEVVNQLEDALWTATSPTIPDLQSHSHFDLHRRPVRFRYTPSSNHVGAHSLSFTVSASAMEDSMTMHVEVLPE